MLPEIPSKEIMDRVFVILEELIKEKKFSGVREFCEKHGFNRKKFSSLKNPNLTQYTKLDMEVYFVLACYYDVSLEWLFFGKGPKYKPEEKQKRNLRNAEILG